MRIGIITGSGTYALPDFEDASAEEVATPFGPVALTAGRFAGAEVLHLSRHLEGHVRVSHQVAHQANISALKAAGADAVLAVTVCGTLDPEMELGTLIAFDDLHFLANRLGDGSVCTLHTEPGAPGRGHWIFEDPFSAPLRGALTEALAETGLPHRHAGCYGHVDGPRFNTKAEIRMLQACGVTAVSQTAGPETTLCGEAELPYALLGYATDYANGVRDEPTPVEVLLEKIQASPAAFAQTLARAVPKVAALGSVPPVGTHFRWE
jgi:purine nucleoside phosphorylase